MPRRRSALARRSRVLALALAAAAAAATGTAGADTTGPSARTAVTPGISLHRFTARRPGRNGYSIRLTYAQLVGGAPGQGSVNARLRDAVRHEVATFVAGVDGHPAPASLPSEVASSELVGNVTETILTPSLVSLRTAVYVQPEGAAHGATTQTSYNLDPRTGAAYTLADLFLPGAHYLQVLSAESRARLMAHLGPLGIRSMIDAGTTPTAAHFSTWNLSPWGLLLTFSDYQVGPYALGDPTVLVPFRALAGLDRRGGPLSEAAAATGPITLLPARTPPVAPACWVTPTYTGGTVPTPLTCDGGHVNAAAWTAFDEGGASVLAVGAQARPVGVERAMCTDAALAFGGARGTAGEIRYVLAAERLASRYYGWRFGTAPAEGFPGYCAHLG